VIDVDTPAAVVDIDRLEANLDRWQAHCDAVGLANRPHVKTHRCVEIARRQVARGAAGITCQKLSEAAVMVDAGIDDVFVPYNIVGETKLEQLRYLLGNTTVAVSVDDERLLPGLATAVTGPRELRVLVDCDTGFGRTGVATPGRAVALAIEIARRDGLRFGGFTTYPASPHAATFLRAAVAEAAETGLESQTVSAGGTPMMWASGELRPTVDEYRAGTYAFHDRATVAAGAATLDEVALTVHATVVSSPTQRRRILDAGSKSLAFDPGPGPGHGTILEAPASSIERLSEEHAIVEVARGDVLELGQRVRVVPNHACVVANLADEVVVVGAGRETTTWRINARGCSR
jgi:D-serine deaminase-like pyridoxal phosphate-dependent protein